MTRLASLIAALMMTLAGLEPARADGPAGAQVLGAGRAFGNAEAGAVATPAEGAAPAGGEGRRKRIGTGRLLTNDLIGDGKDRWRTGSLVTSRLWGPTWQGQAPAGFGDLLELRLMGQILAPDNLRNPASDDRPWAGALSVGVHTHMQRGATELSLGGDLVFIGPRTGLDSLQDALHELVETEGPSETTLASQIPNRIRPSLSAEAGRSIQLASFASLRPFAEVRAGDETLMRIGADVTFAQGAEAGLLLRDPVTGHRYRAILGGPAVRFTLGGDIAHVASSVYLPSGRGYQRRSERHRLRAGLHWQTKGSVFFYGLTYLGREFSTQDEGQLVGSLSWRRRF